MDVRDSGRRISHDISMDDGASLRHKYYIFADNYLLSAKESHDCLGVAFAAVLCSDIGICVVFASGAEFPKRADVQDEGNRRGD